MANPVTSLFEPSSFNAVRDTEFWLSTRSNPTSPYRIHLNDPTSLRNAKINVQHPTRVLIHGWTQNSSSSELDVLGVPAYLSRADYNVIVVDWKVCAQTINYFAVIDDCVPEVGRVIAQFLDWLNASVNLSFSSITAVGNSLGAHVAGFAGKFVTRGRLASIVGLDTAKPGYGYADSTRRLASTDAEYVESVHTAADLYGFAVPIGQAAFYMNWGQNQPSCGRDWSGACSHKSAVIYFIESIYDPDAFWGTRCLDYGSIRNRKCPAAGEGAAMGGEPVRKKVAGVYYVETNSKAPYGQGKP